MIKLRKNIELNKFPHVEELFNFLNEKLELEDEEITTIDFDSDDEKEYNLYKKLGLKTETGGDCAQYFVNHSSGGLRPSSYGWSSCYLKDLTEEGLSRLEYFLEYKIFKPFRMETWYGEYPNRMHDTYSINLESDSNEICED